VTVMQFVCGMGCMVLFTFLNVCILSGTVPETAIVFPSLICVLCKWSRFAFEVGRHGHNRTRGLFSLFYTLFIFNTSLLPFSNSVFLIQIYYLSKESSISYA
jgi:hypothetical protein